MKKTLFIIYALLLPGSFLMAQQDNSIIVRAGTRLIDYFPVKERYRYPDFKDGQLMYKDGKSSPGRFNYNFLLGEMEFLQSNDTLSIINKRDISFIVAAQDTFYYNNGYIEQILGGPVRVGLTQNFKLTDIRRKGAFGVTDRNSSIDTYNSMSVTGNYYGLVPNEDLEFRRIEQYYLAIPAKSFVLFNRKNLIENFPQGKDAIKNYLKSNRVDYYSRKDLFKLVEFLGTLKP